MNPSHETHKDSTRLAFDCSLVGVSAALLHKGKLYHRHDHSANKQAGQLLPMIAELLTDAGIGYDAVDTLITTNGPGSFTGIRIGLAAAQGIVTATGMQTIPLTTLEALAFSMKAEDDAAPFWVAFNAGKGEIYAQLFHVKQAVPEALNDIALLSPADFIALYKNEPIIGNAAALLPDLAWHASLSLPAAKDFIHTLAPAQGTDCLRPLYIRAPDAKLPATALPLE